MPHIPSIMSLHLRYRLWIEEMNSDINIIRIFSDYLKELESKKDEPEVKTDIDYFQQQFINLRKDIDELRGEMHILKMKLATYFKQEQRYNYKTYKNDNHPVLKKRYLAFRRKFIGVKKKFVRFEGKWLN
jgi:hypothetical protein